MELILKKGVNLIKWDFFVRLRTLFNLDIEMFAQFLICGIGVAGVFLALYYSNISTMYSIEYSNAPQRVRSLFENAIKENKSLSDIIQYLILSVLILGLLILGIEISYVFVGVIIIKSVNIIISFIINGNKIYRYSDVYDVLYARLCKLIFLTQNATCDGYQSNDGEIQKIYNAEAVAIFEDMNIVNNYFMAKNSITNFSASQNFVVSNLIILKNYFRLKNRIPTYSLWFKKEIEYKKWFAADFMTKKMALNTGTQLYPNYNTNVNWFEESILFVNNKTLDFLLANGCYVEIMYYIYNLAEISECWIKFGNTNLLLDHIRELSLKIEKSVLTLENNTKVEIEDVIEALCYLYKKCCLDFMKYISNLNIDEVDKLYKTDFSETECLKFNNKIFSSSAGVNICKKLKNEISIENKLVTPLWFVKQIMAKLYIDEISNCLEIIEEIYEFNLKLEAKLYENKKYVCSSSFVINENELYNKIMFYSHLMKESICSIMANDIEKEHRLKAPEIETLIERIKKLHIKQAPEVWEKHCKMWLIRMAEDKRDIFGFCYNNLCEYVFECIINFDFDSFSKYYVKLFGISTISEFGIKDVVKDIGINDIAKFRYQISGLDMLFEISGYAIIVGDILKTNCWKKLIDDTLKKTLIVEESNGVQNVEQIKRWKDIIAVVSKNFGFLHMIDITNMNLRFKEAINGSGKLEYENVGMFGHKRVINSQNLAMLYYDDTGFSVEMREIYAIATLNRYLPISERYESKRLKIKEWIDLND